MCGPPDRRSPLAGVGGSLSDRGASLTGPRSLAADLSVKSQQFVCVQFDVS